MLRAEAISGRLFCRLYWCCMQHAQKEPFLTGLSSCQLNPREHPLRSGNLQTLGWQSYTQVCRADRTHYLVVAGSLLGLLSHLCELSNLGADLAAQLTIPALCSGACRCRACQLSPHSPQLRAPRKQLGHRQWCVSTLYLVYSEDTSETLVAA